MSNNIDSLGSIVLQDIEVSALQSCPCPFCAKQDMHEEAYLILSRAHKKTGRENCVRVMCNNGHIFATSNQTIHNIRNVKDNEKEKDNIK